MVAGLFIDLTVIIAVTVVVSVLMRVLRQPLIIGYILVGIVLGPYVLNIIEVNDTFEVFSKLGIGLLLFVVGLGLSPALVKGLGKVAVITGVGQIVFTSVIGFVIAALLGFSAVEAAYIAIALTFSSTIIIMKLLSDRGDLESLHGRIAIGFLIVQDIAAVLILMVLSSTSGINGSLAEALTLFLVGALLVLLLLLFGRYLSDKLLGFFAKSQELLLLFSLSWCFLVAAVFEGLGFSLEIGALLAGVTLSMSNYRWEIASKMKPLRDFFIVLFFIILGTKLIFAGFGAYFWPTAIFSTFILIGNPLVVIFLMGLLGYRKKTGFLAGLTVAQISEFSLILVALGLSLGHLSAEVVSMVTYIGIITIAGSSYFIVHADSIYPRLSKLLAFFERRKSKVDHFGQLAPQQPEVILFGHNRIGGELLKPLKKISQDLMVVDYNPEVISDLAQRGFNCVYGDAGDSEFLDELDFSKVRMVISTIGDFDTNALLIARARREGKRVVIVVTSEQTEGAQELYEKGANYVILPHLIGGHYLSSVIKKHGFDIKGFLEEKIAHLEYLREREGHS